MQLPMHMQLLINCQPSHAHTSNGMTHACLILAHPSFDYHCQRQSSIPIRSTGHDQASAILSIHLSPQPLAFPSLSRPYTSVLLSVKNPRETSPLHASSPSPSFPVIAASPSLPPRTLSPPREPVRHSPWSKCTNLSLSLSLSLCVCDQGSETLICSRRMPSAVSQITDALYMAAQAIKVSVCANSACFPETRACPRHMPIQATILISSHPPCIHSFIARRIFCDILCITAPYWPASTSLICLHV
ncbi:hypothetical protein B0I35DRAFT_19238 [Stachybotrys elegans]|uniref:Uncharacterized protein n=1 Tax=Stachybotrys elegans TaxID=80388 RepID=A0A8K0T6X0_9HYPO|nr:hypothetical protein B0I35DRAFT_19238 [Stachybotrys elegans]